MSEVRIFVWVVFLSLRIALFIVLPNFIGLTYLTTFLTLFFVTLWYKALIFAPIFKLPLSYYPWIKPGLILALYPAIRHWSIIKQSHTPTIEEFFESNEIEAQYYWWSSFDIYISVYLLLVLLLIFLNNIKQKNSL